MAGRVVGEIASGSSRLWTADGLTIYKNINGVIRSRIFYGIFLFGVKSIRGSFWRRLDFRIQREGGVQREGTFWRCVRVEWRGLMIALTCNPGVVSAAGAPTEYSRSEVFRRSLPLTPTIDPTNHAPQRPCWFFEVNSRPRCEFKCFTSKDFSRVYAVFRDPPQPSPPVSRE